MASYVPHNFTHNFIHALALFCQPSLFLLKRWLFSGLVDGGDWKKRRTDSTLFLWNDDKKRWMGSSWSVYALEYDMYDIWFCKLNSFQKYYLYYCLSINYSKWFVRKQLSFYFKSHWSLVFCLHLISVCAVGTCILSATQLVDCRLKNPLGFGYLKMKLFNNFCVTRGWVNAGFCVLHAKKISYNTSCCIFVIADLKCFNFSQGLLQLMNVKGVVLCFSYTSPLVWNLLWLDLQRVISSGVVFLW